MPERVRVREIDDDEGRRLLRIIRRGAGSVVTWRRAQMVLLSAQGMPVAKIAEVSFTSDDRVRDVIHNFNADGFDSLYPKYSGGRPKTFTLPERREIKKIAKSKPTEHDLPFSTWSLTKLADFLVAEGVVDDISHEGLRILLREEGVSFQRLKTWKTSRDPDYAAEKARVEHLHAIADGEVIPEDGEPEVVTGHLSVWGGQWFLPVLGSPHAGVGGVDRDNAQALFGGHGHQPGLEFSGGHAGDELPEPLPASVLLPGLLGGEVKVFDADRGDTGTPRPVDQAGQSVADLGVAVTGRTGQVVVEAVRGTDRVAVPVEPVGGEMVRVGVDADHSPGTGNLQRDRPHGGRCQDAVRYQRPRSVSRWMR
ncbi:helix-turn-helix domain-containing protein [Streptomyces sp. NBC_01800]|uniref:helix-turn-helix domain-containing protein n=1 Tax=Streptomyces sp. NBC_01800 TaxID=2975945 RepID=UPI002DDC776B|nr:helix-turn-helix domain-containing protein [Streptomyces sp. NBC_01800]